MSGMEVYVVVMACGVNVVCKVWHCIVRKWRSGKNSVWSECGMKEVEFNVCGVKDYVEEAFVSSEV